MVVEFTVPIRLVSEANARDHWAVVMKRKQDQKAAMLVAWRNEMKGHRVTLPCTVTLTRLGAKILDDDNLAGSGKAVRDQIASLIGIDDGSKKIKFIYIQEAGHKTYGLKCKVEWGEPINTNPPASDPGSHAPDHDSVGPRRRAR